jgi:hypothetical protein
MEEGADSDELDALLEQELANFDNFDGEDFSEGEEEG